MLRRFDEAQKAYREVLDLDPQNSVALGFMGMVYHLKGDIDKAILTYHEVCLAYGSLHALDLS